MTTGVHVWWILLSVASVLNIGAWIVSAAIFFRRKLRTQENIYVWRRAVLWLSGVYVLGCAFRSFVPRIDLERICLVDSWLSTMIVGHTIATIAKICFIAQCTILLQKANIGTHMKTAITFS
jgi:hypothetical protein